MYKKLKNSKIKTEQFFKEFCSIFCVKNFCHSSCIFLTVLTLPYNNADKYYGHTLSGYSDKIEIELSALAEALKNASWPVNDAESSETNISQKDGNGNTERAAEPSERAKALAEEIKKVDGQLQGYDALNEAIAANIEKEFGAMEYKAENLEKIKKYAGLKNSNAQNLDEVLEEIRAGKLQEGERAFLKQLKGNLINEMGKELAEGSARENIEFSNNENSRQGKSVGTHESVGTEDAPSADSTITQKKHKNQRKRKNIKRKHRRRRSTRTADTQ